MHELRPPGSVRGVPGNGYSYRDYREDFESGYKGIRSREQFFAQYAAQLSDVPEHQQRMRVRKMEIRHLDYDWNLNDARR